MNISSFGTAPRDWTPVATYVTPGDVSVSYATQTGRYFVLGRLVFWDLYLVCTPTYTTASGIFVVDGLPYVSSARSNGDCSFSSTGTTWPGGRTSLCSYLGAASDRIQFLVSGSGAGYVQIQASDMTSASQIFVSASGWYHTDDMGL